MFNFLKKPQKPIDIINRINPNLIEIINIVNVTQDLPADHFDKKTVYEIGIFIASVVLYKVSAFKKTDFRNFSDEFSNIYLKSVAESQADYDSIWDNFYEKLPVYQNLLNTHFQAPNQHSRVSLLRELLANCTNKKRGGEELIMDIVAAIEFMKVILKIMENTYE
jgi:hypothetical protein